MNEPAVPIGVTPAAASVAVRPLVTGPPRAYTVVAAFPRAAYLVLDPPAGGSRGTAEVVALVTSDGVANPNALQLARPSRDRPLAGIHAGHGRGQHPGRRRQPHGRGSPGLHQQQRGGAVVDAR